MEDIIEVNGECGIMMGTPRGDEFIKIPSSEEIKLFTVKTHGKVRCIMLQNRSNKTHIPING